jgi:hypothetical protein
MNSYAIRHVNTALGLSLYLTFLPKDVVDCDETVRQLVSQAVTAASKGIAHPRMIVYPLDAPDGQEVSTQVCWQADAGQLIVLREIPEEQPT